MTEKKHISELHEEHKTWLSSLNFYRDELGSFQNRLDEVAKANTGKDVLTQVEVYQNKFIRANELLDELIHEVNAYEHELVLQVKMNPVASDHRLLPDHAKLRDKIESFSKTFTDTKHDFTAMLAKVL